MLNYSSELEKLSEGSGSASMFLQETVIDYAHG
jgi:hypothetical protein